MQNVAEHSKAISLEQRKVVMKTQALCLEGKMPSPRFRERNKKNEWFQVHSALQFHAPFQDG